MTPAVPACFVVIRAAGERTEALCRRLAEGQVGEDRVRLIREVPFAAAVRRGFELGVEAGQDWTLCLDADVLLAEGAIAALVHRAEEEVARDPSVFEVEGSVADKLLGQIRPAGVHLYRTEHLPRALEDAEFDAAKRRPETHLKRQMGKAGFPSVTVDLVHGLHDFEQSYTDIFRKVFTHARKHERYMSYAMRYWTRMAPSDLDLRIALWSCHLSTLINEQTDFSQVPETERVAIDMRAFPDNLDAILTPAGLTEKAPLDADALSAADISARLEGFEVSPEYLEERDFIDARFRNRGRLAQARAQLSGMGPLGMLRHHAGAAALSLGRRWTFGKGR